MATLDAFAEVVPELENGDHLSRTEFERRYRAMAEVKKAELIEGVVYMPSPVRARKHGQPHSDIVTWLGTYVAAMPGVMACDNTTVRLDLDNEPQPDALLRVEETFGGQSRISEDDYIEGAPELIVEIASSSAAYDAHEKLQVYRRNGVQEYVIWFTGERRICWYRLREGRYQALTPDEQGVFQSEVFPGLWLDVPALLEGRLRDVLTILQRGLESSAS
jgi:Uma2 family endonuclease